MSKKLTIVKVLPRSGEFSPSPEDLEKWRKKFAEAEVTLEEATATGEVVIETVAEKVEDEHYITLVKIGTDNYKPTTADFEAWRQVFEMAAKDPDFKIFTHPDVEISVINIGKIIDVE